LKSASLLPVLLIFCPGFATRRRNRFQKNATDLSGTGELAGQINCYYFSGKSQIPTSHSTKKFAADGAEFYSNRTLKPNPIFFKVGVIINYPAKPEKVYFFGRCVIDMAYPEAGLAGIKLIQREGVKVIFPPAQSCCGQPAYNSGFMDEARAVARKQVALFPKDYPIIVPSGFSGRIVWLRV
jgi:Fe-S oxidoreductase